MSSDADHAPAARPPANSRAKGNLLSDCAFSSLGRKEGVAHARSHAALTLGQVVAYDLPRSHDFIDFIVVALAVLAPTFAAILLWNARVHRATR